MDPIGDQVANPQTYADMEGFHALFARLRDEASVRWTTPAKTQPFWLLSRHADIIEIERQPEIFLSGPRLELYSLEQEATIQATHAGRTTAIRSILHMDGAEHRSYRAITQGWFMSARLKKLEQGLDDLAKEHVDALADSGGEADFVSTVAV